MPPVPVIVNASVWAYLAYVSVGAFVVVVLRRSLFAWVKRVSPGAASAGGDNVHLAPAELAYLVRSGDVTHAVIVMAVDLCQRYLKRGAPGEDADIELAPYETEAAAGVRLFLRNWAVEKADSLTGKHLPDLRKINPLRNPLEIMWQLRALRSFITGPVAQVLQDIIKDPRHLRKYFSPAGIARLVVDLYSRGVKTAVETSMIAGLTGRSLLVDRRRRQTARQAALGLLLAAAAFFVAGAWMFLQFDRWLLFFALLCGFGNGVLVLVKLAIPGFLPAYEEFAMVLADLDRQGVRIRLARGLLIGVKRLFAFTTVLMLVILAVVELILGAGILQLPLLSLFVSLVSSTIAAISILTVCADWHKLSFQQIPTDIGEELCRRQKLALNRASPLAHLKQAFADSQYDPTFSELVAIYGVETLWLLS